MERAVFIDRDGVLNKEIGRYVTCLEEFELNTGVPEALRNWQDQGFKLIVITNQGGIAKGLYTHDCLRGIHEHMKNLLSQDGVRLTDIFYSPHHPDFGNSLSRKPGSLMLEKALAKYGLEAAASYMIGDQPRDMECAEKAGVKGILVPPNSDLRQVRLI
jgi:D-glycero-D-manno-heptose 1,7-bisphosphate phosphatase